MIKVKAEANYGFAGTNMTFEEEFGDDEIWLWNRLIGHGRKSNYEQRNTF